MENNVICEKSYKFALRIVKLYRYLGEEKKEYVLSRQLLRSGTSIGANIEEALDGQSRKDFISKMNISLKEVRETIYWIRLLRDSEIIEDKHAKGILEEAIELKRILTSIVKTSKSKGCDK